MSRYVKRPRPEPTSESFLILFILFGPLAWPMRCFCAWLRRQLDGLQRRE